MSTAFGWLGSRMARYLAKPIHTHGSGPATRADRLMASLKAGDVLLVEGHSRFSTVIKYLTQSTWSHAALYVGDHLAKAGGNPEHCFVEADVVEGVRSVAIGEFTGMHTRICRPVGLNDSDVRQVTTFVIERLGMQYNLRNVIDLMRYLLPTPPIPQRFRRRMISLGSGDPTRAICSTLIAQAFQSISYPILPIIDSRSRDAPDCPNCREEFLQVRHHSLFAPRDFDVSPYFELVKPSIYLGLDFRTLRWADPTSPSI